LNMFAFTSKRNSDTASNVGGVVKLDGLSA